MVVISEYEKSSEFSIEELLEQMLATAAAGEEDPETSSMAEILLATCQ